MVPEPTKELLNESPDEYIAYFHQVSELSVEELQNKNEEFWADLNEKLSKLGTILLGGFNEAGVLDGTRLDSIFSYLLGLATHDIKKPQFTLNQAATYREFGMYPEWNSDIPYEQSFKIELMKFLGFIEIFWRGKDSSDQNTWVTRSEFMRTLGIDNERTIDGERKYDTMTNAKGEPVDCVVDIDFDFDSIEEFISTRTIVINAIEAGAHTVLVRKVDDYGIEVFDDLSTSWESNSVVAGYKTGLISAYELGITQPDRPSDKEERGGAIAAFLAGQRMGRLKSSNPSASQYPLIELIDNVELNGVEGKSYRLYFPPGSTITDGIGKQLQYVA
jgi:hypothetical protein